MSRRDRRGRGLRAPMFPMNVPAYRSRAERFDDVVIAVVTDLERRWARELKRTEFGVEEVPASDPSPWERDGVPLARLFPSQSGHPARIVLYRRPIEHRLGDPNDLAEVIRTIVVEQVAILLDESPETIDPGYSAG